MLEQDKFVPFTGFQSALTDKLSTTDTDLPIHDEHKAALVNHVETQGGGYIYLTIKDGVATEVVKATVSCGGIFIERGSNPHTFPRGACVFFQITAEGVVDLINQTPVCCSQCNDPIEEAI